MCTSYNYRGFIVYHNDKGNNFDHSYISIVNPLLNEKDGHKAHCHVVGNDSYAKKIIDCAVQFRKYGCITNGSISMRDKACRLNGLKIMEKY